MTENSVGSASEKSFHLFEVCTSVCQDGSLPRDKSSGDSTHTE